MTATAQLSSVPTTATLDRPYRLTTAQVDSYQRNGFIKLKEVLDAATIAHYGQEISSLVQRLNTNTKPMEERTTYGRAFIQIGNLWRQSAVVEEFVRSKRLAGIAAALMRVDGVRLYHDQALYKESGGGITPWHCDQFYWPIASDNTVTAWIPLQAVPREMGPLAFAIGSQRIMTGRHLEISDTSEREIGLTLKDCPIEESAFDLGEVSFHSGWCFHRAGPNQSGDPRAVMTIIYHDAAALVSEPRNASQRADLAGCLPGCKPGDLAASPLNPQLFP